MKVILGIALTLLSAVASAETITFAGSSTIRPIMENMMPVLEKHDVQAKIQGGGSGVGLKSVKMGMAQVGMVSRGLTQEESSEFANMVIARDWVVIIVNKAQTMENITTSEVKEIYTGKKSAWANGGKIHVVGKEAGRATKEVFEGYFGIEGEVRKDAVIIGPNGQAIATVAGDANAIAYVSYADAEEAVKAGESIKILTLDGQQGDPANVAAGNYKLARDLNLVFSLKNEALQTKMRLILGDKDARKVFEEHHVMPVL